MTATEQTPRLTTERTRLPSLDVVRVLTFGAVIAVHVVSYAGRLNVAANAVEVILHFTREAFFALTGFVLIHQYLGRDYQVGSFYRKRLKAVVIPYVAWSVIYASIAWYQGPRTETFSHWVSQLGWDLLEGKAVYILYFLVVTMQVYLLFPLIERLIQATRNHHVWLLVVSAVLQFGIFELIQHPPSSGPLHWMAEYSDILFTSYQFYVLLGAVAAAHRVQIVEWLRRYWPIVIAAVAASVAFGLWVYFHKLDLGQTPRMANAVLQPMMLPLAASIILALFALGSWWARHRKVGGTAETIFAVASDRSFGIFLVHPFVLRMVAQNEHYWLPAHMHALPLALIRYVLVVIGSVLLAELMRRSPLSLILTGRTRLAGLHWLPQSRSKSQPRTGPREDAARAHDESETPRTHAETAQHGSDDDDRQRPAKPLLR